MKKPKFVLRFVDLFMLFVFGFTFFIGVFDPFYAISYLVFLMLGSIYLGFTNPLFEKKKKESEK